MVSRVFNNVHTLLHTFPLSFTDIIINETHVMSRAFNNLHTLLHTFPLCFTNIIINETHVMSHVFNNVHTLFHTFPLCFTDMFTMSALLQPSVYTEEEERGARLNYLLCDTATITCRLVFHKTLGHPESPIDLCAHFANGTVYAILRKLKNLRRCVITHEQWDLLYPPVPLLPNSSTFDITLWMVLLRSICNLSSPSNGWGQDPRAGDNTLSANLVRLRLCRNRLRGHIVSTSLSEDEFNIYWQEVEDILIALGCPKTEIDKRKTKSLDPNMVKRNNDLLNELKETEELMDKEINTIKEDQVQLRQQVFKNTDDVELNRKQLENLKKDSIKKLKTDVELNASELSTIKLKVNENSTSLENLRKDRDEQSASIKPLKGN